MSAEDNKPKKLFYYDRLKTLTDGTSVAVKGNNVEVKERIMELAELSLKEETHIVQVIPKSEYELKNASIGISKIDGKYFVDVVRYNPETMHAKVVEHVFAGVNVHEAQERFKILSVKHGVVGQ